MTPRQLFQLRRRLYRLERRRHGSDAIAGAVDYLSRGVRRVAWILDTV